MKKLAFGIITGGIIGAVLILIIMVIFDTNRKKNQEGIRLVVKDSAKANNEPKKPQLLVYGDYMDLDSTNFLLIPLGMKTGEDEESRLLKNRSSDVNPSESYTGSYRSYKYNFYSLDFGNCNNIIFYNKKTDDTHLLLQRPAVISQFYFPYYSKEYTEKKYWFLLIGVHEEDTNGDGYINNEDTEKVYISNLSGQNMIQISPDNSQFIDWYIDEATNNILMKVRLDSNNDKKYTAMDDIEILKTAISIPEQGKPIIGAGIKKDIKKILEQIK